MEETIHHLSSEKLYFNDEELTPESMIKEFKHLKAENIEMKEKLETYIPRRRVRRVFKQLKNILEEDLVDENKVYIQTLTDFINKIEKEGPQTAGQDIKQAIEHLLSIVELPDGHFEDNKDNKCTK